MQFDQAFQSPVIVEIDGLRVSLPKMTMGIWKTWGKIADAEREAKITAGMKPEERRRHLSFYVVQPLELNQIKALARTPEGIEKVIVTCAGNARVIAERPTDPQTQKRDPEKDFAPVEPRPLTKAEQGLFFQTPSDDQERLASELAELEDRLELLRQAQERQEKDDDEAAVAAAESFAGEKVPDPLT